MNDLVERYVHQVGRYVPQRERSEIEAELRSQIYDQLEDRYGGAPSQEDVVTVLAEMGDPRLMVSAYYTAPYLVGAELHPYMMIGLRYGWMLVPAITVFLTVFDALTSGQTLSLTSVVITPVFAAVQNTLTYTGFVVLLFAAVQHFGISFEETRAFNPLDMPEVDDPHKANRAEAVSGLVLGTLFMLIVGGLTVRSLLTDPGALTSAMLPWLLLLNAAVMSMTVVQVIVLRTRWSLGLGVVQIVLEIIGVVCLYVAVYQPVYERLVAAVPSLSSVPLTQILVVITAASTLASSGTRLIRLWNTRKQPAAFTVQTSK